ncbi:hypothetical protein [Ekhidna sp.]|uniref:hypothetical protein n=1 Tax=Ekhidna sp. TaxID=2608089 RepID=UPI0032ED51EB
MLHSGLIAFLAFLGFRFVKTELPGWVYWLGLLLKLSAGIVLGLIFYEYYESGDTIAFFEAAKNLTEVENQPRTQFFLKILRPVVVFTDGSYWITSLYFSFISFISFWYGLKVLSNLYPDIRWLITICFLIIPSIVFWSSGIIKDSMASAALIVFVVSMIQTYKLKRLLIPDLILILIGGFILLYVKHYLFITAIIFSAVLFSLSLYRQLQPKWRFASILVIFIALVGTQFVHPYLAINRIPWTLQQNNQAILEKSDSEDRLNIVLEEDSWTEVISNVPKALHAGLFRPSLFDQTPVWGWIHRVENFLLIILMMMSIILFFKKKHKIDWALFVGSLCGILLLAIMLPLSTPNFGTLVRYKNSYMPYLFLICSVLPYHYFTSQAHK